MGWGRGCGGRGDGVRGVGGERTCYTYLRFDTVCHGDITNDVLPSILFHFA